MGGQGSFTIDYGDQWALHATGTAELKTFDLPWLKPWRIATAAFEFDFTNDGNYSNDFLNVEGCLAGLAKSIEIRFDKSYESISPMSLGIDWLQQQQLLDESDPTSYGSWSNDAANTSMAVLAMLNAGYSESDPIVADGIRPVSTKQCG